MKKRWMPGGLRSGVAFYLISECGELCWGKDYTNDVDAGQII